MRTVMIIKPLLFPAVQPLSLSLSLSFLLHGRRGAQLGILDGGRRLVPEPATAQAQALDGDEETSHDREQGR